MADQSLFPTFSRWRDQLLRSCDLKEHLRFPKVHWRASRWWASDPLIVRQQGLLRMLAFAHREQIDYAEVISRYASEQSLFDRLKLKRLCKRLQSGSPLASALEQTPTVLDDDATLAIRLGSQSGNLGNIFEELTRNYPQYPAKSEYRARYLMGYVITLLVALTTFLVFYLVFITPALQKTLEESNAGVPNSLRALIEGGRILSDWWFIWATLILIALVSYTHPRLNRWFRHTLGQATFPPYRQQVNAQILSLLAVTVEGGRPIAGALSTLARYHFNKVFRQKLLFARNEVEQGNDVWSALSDAELLRPNEAQGLACIQEPARIAWVLHKLAGIRQTRNERVKEIYVVFVQFAVILFFALIVLFIGYAATSTLAQLINSQT